MTLDPAETKMQFLFNLRSRGVTDARVLTAMERTDRAGFVTGIFAGKAYDDMPLPIACSESTIWKHAATNRKGLAVASTAAALSLCSSR